MAPTIAADIKLLYLHQMSTQLSLLRQSSQPLMPRL